MAKKFVLIEVINGDQYYAYITDATEGGGGWDTFPKPLPEPTPPTEPPPVEPPKQDTGNWTWAWDPRQGKWVWVKVPGAGETGPKKK